MSTTTRVFAAALGVVLLLSGCSGADDPTGRSSQEVTVVGANSSNGCTFTQGYWKNHASAWPVASLTLGSVTYTQAQLLVIFNTPVKGNGLISLAHQLIAAKLNIAAGASTSAISSAINAGDALIGSLVVGTGYLAPSATSSVTGSLDQYNNGQIGPGHCGSNPPPPIMPPPPITPPITPPVLPPPPPAAPICGNGIVETGEHCDDGNTTSRDGCSSTCECEPEAPTMFQPAPVCGNGLLEFGEYCDDGNLVCGDGCSDHCVEEV